jgi:hypothetical protein
MKIFISKHPNALIPHVTGTCWNGTSKWPAPMLSQALHSVAAKTMPIE